MTRASSHGGSSRGRRTVRWWCSADRSERARPHSRASWPRRSVPTPPSAVRPTPLVHEYPTPHGVLVHIDAYRLPDAAALEQLGLDETLERARLVVVEWGTGLLARHPEALWLELERHGESRSATLRDATGRPLGWAP